MDAAPVITCPRRMYEFGPWEYTEGLDRWSAKGGLVNQARLGSSCSFCGSLHPDTFMEMVRDGARVGPTDKNYKVYVQRAPTGQELAARKAEWLARDPTARKIRELAEGDRDTGRVTADLDQCWHESGEEMRGIGPEGKFYFPHLSPSQQAEYIDLHNVGRITYSYPGHLYVLPYFCTPAG